MRLAATVGILEPRWPSAVRRQMVWDISLHLERRLSLSSLRLNYAALMLQAASLDRLLFDELPFF
jgi:hypothetical protein